MKNFNRLFEEIRLRVRGAGFNEVELSPEAKAAAEQIASYIVKSERELGESQKCSSE